MLALRLSRRRLFGHHTVSFDRDVWIKTLTNQRHASMSAWTISDSLDNPNEIEIRHKLKCVEKRIPSISGPSDVLVKVHSTSINPLDVRMCYGYGRRVLDLLDMFVNREPRITNDRYPLTLGRDFSGEVIAVGPSAREFKPGDLVFGPVEPYRSGAHAEFLTVPSYCVSKKPENLSHQEAASIPFVALTAHSALTTFGGLSDRNCDGKSMLVLGGSGGVGSFAIQLLKLWGADVIATCSEEKIDYLENTLFVDQAIDYNDLSRMDSLKHRFDFVLDCGDYESTSKTHQDMISHGTDLLKPYSQSVYVTLSPPILKNTDQRGVILGAAETAISIVQDTLTSLKNLNSARWAVFLPNKQALQYISDLYEDQALTPHVHSVFAFHRVPEAYEELQSGKARGKVVVDVTKKVATDGEHESSKKKESSPET